MAAIYHCPNTLRVRGFKQILCKSLLPDGKVPTEINKKAESCCGFQYFCPNTQRWEHSQGCTNCRLRQRNGGDR